MRGALKFSVAVAKRPDRCRYENGEGRRGAAAALSDPLIMIAREAEKNQMF